MLYRTRGHIKIMFSAVVIVVFAIAITTQAKEKITRIMKTNEEWKKTLTKEQFHVCREKGTEQAFTGKYWNNHDKGVYTCICCGLELFSSEAKFESGTGWPSYFKPIEKEHVKEEADNSFSMHRTEVLCARCDAHLGHLFPDGPKPTGMRYCINSASLSFKASEK